MRGIIFTSFLLYCSILQSFAQSYSISGRVVDSNKQLPVEFAAILLPEQQLWATAGSDGGFTISNIPAGEISVRVSCLGYLTADYVLDIHADSKDLVLTLRENNLSLGEVVVMAKEKTEATTNSYHIGRNALDHLQTQSIADITSLLPGGKTNINTHLATGEAQEVSIRSAEKNESGHGRFGTAIEIDGVRLSNNSAFSGLSAGATSLKGVDIRNISSTNIESIEVVTGVPSVEYGDVSNGMMKIKTKEGITPFNIELAAKPNSKQYALNKGFALNGNAGLVNVSVERTSSVSELTSPYTTYDRNGLTLRYSNTFGKSSGRPLKLTAGLSGNIGGYDNTQDPDAYSNVYKKSKANTLRMNFTLNWLLNKSWITNLELSASAVHSDNKSTFNDYKSASSSTASIHATEEGYYVSERYEDNPDAAVVIIPRGHWYQKEIADNKPRDYTAKLKADWARKFNGVLSTFMVGTDLSYAKNEGRGVCYETPSDEKYVYYVPTWREYKYKDQPGMLNLAFFAEEKIDIPIGMSRLQLVAGLRSDITSIRGSEYGTVSSLSPRLNARYTFWDKRDGLLKKLTVRGGWGKSVKLPSLAVLYPEPSYKDRMSFSTASMEDGTAYSAYHVYPTTPLHNPDLKWQSSRLAEIGLEARLANMRISLTAFHNIIANPYKYSKAYVPYSYNLTALSALTDLAIPVGDRAFAVDKTAGIVTVSDKTGSFPSQQLEYRNRPLLRSGDYYSNASDTKRKGLEWVVDFDRIPALNTSFSLDGSYLSYRAADETLAQESLSDSHLMTDGNFYKYVGYYIGSNKIENGFESKQLNANLTIVTHIPKVRMIVSLRIEGTLINAKRNLSEYGGGNRGFVLAGKDGYTDAGGDIYAGDRYIGMYPLYYSAIEDQGTRIPFREAFLKAKEEDPSLYNELAKLVRRSNTDYYFNEDNFSPYFTMNISVTKEIGKIASLSFDARNFTNTTARIKSSARDSEISLYDIRERLGIPRFYYGLSLRIKL